MIIGGDAESTVFFREKFARVFPGPIHTCSAMESELAKYAANLYWATRVTFVNEFALICKQFGVDYENVGPRGSAILG
jgi:UDPglucose 6-dehydrogenase